MDEAVLMTRTLALLGYIEAMFQDHGDKPLSRRAQGIKTFLQREMKKGNPYNTNDPDKGYYHQITLVEVLGEEVLHCDNLADLDYAITDGHFSGEVSHTGITWTSRELTDELLMSQASDPSFLNKNGDYD